MKTKFKIALLTLLGFSTAACCGTKKVSKGEDKKGQDIVTDEEDPRIMLMYGVPLPDGRIAVPIDENGNPVEEPTTEEVKQGEGVPFPDGRVVSPLSEEEAQKRIEEMRKADEEAKANAETETEAETKTKTKTETAE